MTWRPLPQPARDRHPVKVAECLDGAVRGLGPSAALMVRLLAQWPAIVGPAVAAHARPVALASGLLTISVDQPAWATQLRYLEADLCRGCDEVLGPGSVSRTSIRVRPG